MYIGLDACFAFLPTPQTELTAAALVPALDDKRNGVCAVREHGSSAAGSVLFSPLQIYLRVE